MAPLKPSGLSSHFSHPLKGVWEKWEIPQGPQSPEWEKWEKWEGVGMDPRRIAPATVGDGGDGLARTWLVLWPAIEPTPRTYQEPVTLERVLADHRAALAALPISEGMDTCAAPIAAPAADTRAGEAGIAGPQKEARHTGSLDRSDALAVETSRGVHHREIDQGRAGHCGSPAEGRRTRGVCTLRRQSFPAPMLVVYCNGVA